jgi:hypothetical protein
MCLSQWNAAISVGAWPSGNVAEARQNSRVHSAAAWAFTAPVLAGGNDRFDGYFRRNPTAATAVGLGHGLGRGASDAVAWLKDVTHVQIVAAGTCSAFTVAASCASMTLKAEKRR